MPTSPWLSLLATACLVLCLRETLDAPFFAVPPRWWREGRVRHDLESFESLESKSELDPLAERKGWRLKVGWLEVCFSRFFASQVLCVWYMYGWLVG